MTPKQEAALRLALEALECNPISHAWLVNSKQALAAINEALAEQQSGIKQVIELYDSPEQPAQQQEPVAVMTVLHLKDRIEIGYGPASAGYDLPTGEYKLYTSPRPSKPWVGLTDEEKSDLWCESTGRDCVNEDTHVFADAIEAKLKERNT